MEIDMENKQWPEEEGLLKQFPQGNPFTVPAGYFDELAQRLQSYVHLDALKQDGTNHGFIVPQNYFDDLSSQVQSRIALEEVLGDEPQGFAVPDGYFEDLSNRIQSRIAIEEIAPATEDAGFGVPQGYFEELSSNLQSRISIEQLAGQPDDAEYAIPDGYFEQLQDQITSRIQLEEMVNADNAFAVPDGYFNNLTESILSQTSEKQEARIVVMQPSNRNIIRRLVSSAAVKYASAACFALIVGITIYIKQTSGPVAEHDRTYLHKELSEIPASAIENYLEQQTDTYDSEHTVVTAGTEVDANSLKQALKANLDAQ
ncbi:hypothetical protein KHS38_08980 [Mucilaginibacter sp. Bleaf8]|uniref:hypothetical protein n=1 Tax=Mucilaginibacter sp. Bleaf8 TaxID=2834430 RepID=UPI001BCC9D0B|nr:hypothetical protein [Mucilaginibacter sp. Bleaf8]MBS7564537.1 hypothetical protein [Mucilaginibacter sp. Bleaf8]